MNDSTVTVTLRAWTDPAAYIDTRFDLMKIVKQRFERGGLTFAYPYQVAVETRPWVAPLTARQSRRATAIRAEDGPPTAPPIDGEVSAPQDR